MFCRNEELKSLLISIITSEKTWQNLSKYGFDKKLEKKRNEFDLAIILNGYDRESAKFYNSFKPEYFILRPNLGFDTAAIAYWIDLVPLEYENYLIMHDDHWFKEDDWLKTIFNEKNAKPDSDILGNVIYSDPRDDYDEYCRKLNIPDLISMKSTDFLHGMSGLFNDTAIKKIKNFKIPYFNSTEKNFALTGERIFTGALYYNQIKFSQISAGPYYFLKHGTGNYRNYLFSTGVMHTYKRQFSEAKEYFYKYYNFCKEESFYTDFAQLFISLAFVHLQLNEKEKAGLFYSALAENYPEVLLSDEVKKLIQIEE